MLLSLQAGMRNEQKTAGFQGGFGMKETEEERDFFKTGKVEDYLAYKNEAEYGREKKRESMPDDAVCHDRVEYW